MAKNQCSILLLVQACLGWFSAAQPLQQDVLASVGNRLSDSSVAFKIDPQEIGIGFDLTGSYGTVAVSFANGSTFNIAKVEAKPAYKDLMRKWSLESSQHVAPPYLELGQYYRDMPRQHLRRLRKSLGLPASPDVEVISTMLLALREAAESFLGHNVSAVLAATPNLIASYQEDIDDSFEFIGLKSLDDPNTLRPILRETPAAAASHGYGLCQNWTDPENCKRELQDMPFEDVVSVLYTKEAFCIEMATLGSVYYSNPYDSSPPTMEFRLGSDEIHHNPKEEYYWESVKDTIYRAMMPGPVYSSLPISVYVFGESSTDAKVRTVLTETLKHFFGEEPKILYEQDIFTPARGAAEIAKRGGY